MADILTLQREVHQNSVDHGFWEASADIPTKLMLIVTELSEALEAYRDGEMEAHWTKWAPDPPEGFKFKSTHQTGASVWRAVHGMNGEVLDQTRKPEGFPVELADVVIRVMDLAGYLGIDLGAVVELKMAYNATRPHLHGRRI